jgi:hypothetical protein
MSLKEFKVSELLLMKQFMREAILVCGNNDISGLSR